MKPKEFIIILIVMVIAFAGIAIVKNFGSDTVKNTSNTETRSDSIQTFWNYYNLATQYRLHGKTDSSITAYQQAIKLNPYHKDALYYLGIMYMKANDFEKANQSWERLTGINPGSERAYNQLGNLYFCITDKNYFHPAKAKLYFERANELNKESLNPNLRLAEIALFQNRTNDALVMFNKLAIMDQKNVEIFFIIGYLYFKSGKIPEAIKYFERIYELGSPYISSSEEGGTDKSAKKESIIEPRDCNLFLDWLTTNLTVAKVYNVRVEMPKAYKEFDEYLKRMRDELNHD